MGLILHPIYQAAFFVVSDKWSAVQKMIILTGANTELAKDDSGKIFKGFSFKEIIQNTVKNAEKHGYTPVVYDLGSLGIGEPFHVDDESFATKGYYEKEVRVGYKSKSLFKPEMIKQCINTYNDFTVYLDGDAQLYDSIDEVTNDDYDVGVTVRDFSELDSEWYRSHYEIVKYVNAGVIFLRPTNATKKFIDNWIEMTKKYGNDQQALNHLVCTDEYPEINGIASLNGVRVKYFPAKKYNFYYFEEGLAPDIKIYHFKGDVRYFYPFDWKKRLYCMTFMSVKNKIRILVKKLT